MKRSVFVHGPTACGKTRDAEAIKSALGLDSVVDGWRNGDTWPTRGALILTSDVPHHTGTHEVLSLVEAMALIRAAEVVEVVPFRELVPALPTAPGILQAAADAIGDRAASRDCPGGERSMSRCVRAFNAITGHQLSEVEGWHFMELLKLARSTAGAYQPDDHVDRAAYAGLAGEAAAREAMNA